MQDYINRFNERFNNFVQKNEECYRFLTPRDQLQGLRSLHFSWKKIAEMLDVSDKTIRRRRHELGMMIGYQSSYSDIPDDELDVFVR